MLRCSLEEIMENDETSVVSEEPLPLVIQNEASTEINRSTSSNNDDDDTSTCHRVPTPSAQSELPTITPVEPFLHSIAPFNPSSRQAQDKAFALFSLTHDDVLFDLGCGDGRLLMTAAQQVERLRCVGIELNPLFVQRGRSAIAKLPLDVQNRVQIRQGNLLLYNDDNHEPVCEKDDDEDPSHQCSNLTIREDATAIYLYLLPKGLARFKTEFLDSLVDERMEHGETRIRIVSFMFRVHGWDPVAIDDRIKGGVRQYLYEFGSDSSSLAPADQTE